MAIEVEHYAIDPDMSRFTVRAFATGMLSALGHSPTLAVRDFTGRAEFAPDAPDAAALHIKIKAGSLNVTDNVSEKDRREIERTMNQEVLETARYPEISEGFENPPACMEHLAEGQRGANAEESRCALRTSRNRSKARG